MSFRSLLTVLIVATCMINDGHAEVLNEESLFRRCYAHITQLRPRFEDPLLAQVKAGNKSAVQACQEVFNSAILSADNGTTLQDANNTVAKAILHTFNELHRSWSYIQSLFSSTSTEVRIASETWYEEAPFGPYVTRALLSPAYNVDSVTQGTDFLQPVRTNMSPTPSYSGVPNTVAESEREFRLTNAGFTHPFAPRGDIIGIRAVSLPPISILPAVRFTNITTLPDFTNIGVAAAATQPLSDVNLVDITAVRGPLTETEQIAIRIEGQLLVTSAGAYTLYLDVDDGGSLLLDGVRIIDRTSVGESSAVIELSAGSHNIAVEYRQRTGTAKLILKWRGPGIIIKQVIPSSALSNLSASYHTHFQPLPLKLSGSEGGGFLGNHNYLLTTFTEATPNFVPDGALVTNRSWARAALSDALCREIPVVRETDAAQFVIADSATPFRQAATCNACHSSIDRQAGLIRGLRYNHLPFLQQTSPLPDLWGIFSLTMLTASMPEDTSWSDIASSDYAKRPPFGHFYFRNLHGELVDHQVRSIEELGAAIRTQDDYYACFAKRYYYYFTGINVSLGDPGDPTYPVLNAPEAFHRDKVLWLGDRLKISKSLSQLIFDIVGSDVYRMSDYGISYQGQVQ